MLPLPKEPKIIQKGENKTTFEIEGLYPGYGVTIGNGLRRVLYSSLPGAAITRVKIKGVQHEFSTIPGVLEDVLNICLNLKQLRFKMYSDAPQTGKLKVKGEKEVKAKDFELPTQAEIINKEAHIATLTDKKTELEMEIQIEKGLGYEPVERRKKLGGVHERLEIGQIPLDAIYSPVQKIKYSVENMRVGERTDFDRLLLEIETDGTITPEEAFHKGCEILIGYFTIFLKKEEEKEISEKKAEKEAEKGSQAEDVMETPVEELKLSQRTINALAKNKIRTLGGIARRGKSLAEMSGFGEVGLEEVKKVLKKFNLEIKEEE